MQDIAKPPTRILIVDDQHAALPGGFDGGLDRCVVLEALHRDDRAGELAAGAEVAGAADVWAVGGPGVLYTRMLAEDLTKRLGVPVIILLSVGELIRHHGKTAKPSVGGNA